MEAHSLTPQRGRLPVPRSRKLLAAFGDERLVEQLRQGNETAFEVLYDRHHPGILSYCRHMLGSLHEAEDALQQAFVSAHRDIVSTEKPIRFKAWIYTIARNRCLSMLRARREHPSDDLEVVSTAGLSEEVQQRADLKELLGDMQELPEEQRAALVLSELGNLSHAEVAEVIGCEATKVKSLVFQARSGLIERRQARDTPCDEIREQLATLRGGSLRRGPLRRHLKACPGCTAFRAEVKRQRQMLAVALPVIPTLGLRESALAAVGTGATSAAGGATATGGVAAAAAAKVGAVKIAVIAIAAGGAAVGGGVAVEQTLRDDPVSTAPAAESPKSAAGTAEEGAEAKSAPAGGAEEAAETDSRAGSEKAGGKSRGQGRGEERGAPGEGRDARDFAAGRGNGRHLGQAKTPPGRTKTPPGRTRTPPRQAPAKPHTQKQNGSANGLRQHTSPTPAEPPVVPTLNKAAEACRTEQKDDPVGFDAQYGTKSNAFGKCVSAQSKAQNDDQPQS